MNAAQSGGHAGGGGMGKKGSQMEVNLVVYLFYLFCFYVNVLKTNYYYFNSLPTVIRSIYWF